MKRKILKIMLYLCGLFCIAYPIYSRFLSFKSQTEIITNYNQEIKAMDKEILENKQKKAEELRKHFPVRWTQKFIQTLK